MSPLVQKFIRSPYAAALLFAAFCAAIGIAGFVFVQHSTARLPRDDAGMMAAESTRIALTVGLLLAIGPVIGFWYRARQKEFAARKLIHFANHDPLTGLMNRNGWLGFLSERLAARPADARPAALLHLYTEGVQAASEALQPKAADDVLMTIADRLVELAGNSSQVARLGN